MRTATKNASFIVFIAAALELGGTVVSSEESVPLINEVMSSNQTSVRDEDGDTPDWIEIYNPGDVSIDLTGYGLSDRPDNPYKWVLPSITLEAEEHMLVFASGKDRKEEVITKN